MESRFLVTGSTGLVGGLVRRALAAEGRDVRAATRRPAAPGDVLFDLLDEKTFAPALAGVRTVMLISRPGDEDAHLLAEPFVASMKQAGVARVVVLSALGSDKRPAFSLRKVEQLVERSGMAWSHVRPNFFMQMLALPPLSSELASQGSLSLPLADARIAYVDAHDVAAVVHRAMLDPRMDGRALDVSGPSAWNHDELLAVLAARADRPLRYARLTHDEARELMLARGMAPRQTERVLTFYRLIREGFCAKPDAEVARLLGRPLRTWPAFVDAHLAAWSPQA
ncbi:NAD(P)H-binding protein [Ramlibacter rhizophilus]|uniref:Epimerase n=1 Tax=Ramlibacter rhizophilus TaxID=1781167 RepID=A0A4Z0BKW9_9BURK|nr:NAD(P)H-binding protein [Ramlibacter rhizophilus]TFY99965.1 epimerase [Ramlibacter rhizophilus]